MGGWPFQDCTSLVSVHIPNTLPCIVGWAFANCESLTTITIPNSVTNIQSNAFEGCTSLTTINIPDSVTTIGDETFKDCSSITTINIPDSVTLIGNNVFDGCDSLNQTLVQEVEIDNLHFRLLMHNQCAMVIGSTLENIESLNIPAKIDFNGVEYCVTTIGNFAFAFSECNSHLTAINIPNSVTNIGQLSFSHCHSLISINIPDGVKQIGALAFNACESLSSINIPNSVTTVGFQSFAGCKSLKYITFKGTINQWKEIDCTDEDYVVHCIDGIYDFE